LLGDRKGIRRVKSPAPINAIFKSLFWSNSGEIGYWKKNWWW